MQLSVSSLGSMALLQHQAVKSVWTPLNFQYPQTDRWLCYRDCIPKCGKVSNFQYPQTDRWLCYRDCIPKCGKVSNFQYPRSDRWLCYRDCIPKCGKVSNFQYPRSDRWLCYSRRSTARSRHRSLSVSSLGSMALLLNLWRCSKNRKWSFSILPRIDCSVTASDERRQLHDVAFQYPRSDRWLCYPQFKPSHQYLTQNFQYPPSDRWLCYSFSLSFARPTVVNFQYPPSDRWLCYADCHLPGWLSKNTFSILPRIDGLCYLNTRGCQPLCFRARIFSIPFSILARIDGSVNL